MTEDVVSVFISYARPDQSRVVPFYDDLVKRGFDAWIDCRNLKPGQNWDFEIKRALSKAKFVIAFISKESFDRRGYYQRELKIALDKMSEKLIDDIYLIPVVLDADVEIPEQMKEIQCISASDANCNERIIDALNYQLQRFGVVRTETQKREGFSWVSQVIKESWEGLPGYEVELEYLDFHSDRYPQISEITDSIKGWLTSTLFEHRAWKLRQMPEIFGYGQNKFLRTNTFAAHCGEPGITGQVLSIQYKVQFYGAGAAHPNYSFRTYCFLIDPLVRIKDLADIFSHPAEAFGTIQQAIRESLREVLLRNEDLKSENRWIEEGTAEWNNFRAFTFGEQGINILLAPYQVAAFAAGSHVVHIPYSNIAPLLRPEYIAALRI